MAKSAFGIDHGYISKAGFRLPGTSAFRGGAQAGGGEGISAKLSQQAQKFQGGVKNLGSKIGQGTFNVGANNMLSGAGRAGAGKRGAKTQMRAGAKVAQAGAGMAKRPGLTGGVAIGGAGAGAAGGGAAAFGGKKKKPGQV